MTVNLIPSINETGLPMLEVFICGKNHLFILDSGSTSNLVSADLKNSVEHSLSGEGTTYSFEGTVADCSIVKMSYSIGSAVHEADFTVTAAATFSVFMEESGLLVEGILGIPFLIEHQCVLDFSEGRLLLEE